MDDFWFYRGILAVLGLTSLASTAGIVVLAVLGKDIPDGLIALGSASVGALAGAIVGSKH